jgi:alpha-D-ribose 1-methylphosphonate 5-triphosphate synthase subunit PhnH
MNQQIRVAAPALLPGFADPQQDAQRVFRRVLKAMSRPGQIIALDRLPDAPAPLSGGAAAIALTLFDLDTPVWLSPELRQASAAYISFHTGAPLTSAIGSASFVLASGGSLPALEEMGVGDLEYPERAATLILQVDQVRHGPGRRLRGPGVVDHVDISVDGLAEEFWAAFHANHHKFPLGFDVLLVAGESILGLPRTIAVGRMED